MASDLSPLSSSPGRKEDDLRAELNKRVLETVRSLREGNMLLDNEPVLYVKGYEQACLDAEIALQNALGEVA